jgi:hypothetical protein
MAGEAVSCACVVVMAGGDGLFTKIVNRTTERPALSVMVRLNATLAFDVGVPATMPLVESSERPLAGRPTACQL